MGDIVETMGCKCFHYERPKDIEKNEKEVEKGDNLYIPKTLIDVKIKTENFVKKRNHTAYDNYEKVLLIEQDAYTEKYKAQKIGGSEIRVIKEIMKNSIDDAQEVLNEFEILKKLDHPNIVKIYEYFEDDEMIHMVEEYHEERDLADKMDKYGTFCEFLVKYLMYNIFIALTFLRKNHVIHGEIKRENILLSFLDKNENKEDIFKRLSENKSIQEELIKASSLDELSPKAKSFAQDLANIEVVLGNFGSAKIKKNHEKNKILTGTSGITFYSSPEVVVGKYDYECDEWSCGVLMYNVLSGVAAFEGKTEEELKKNILEKQVNFFIPELNHVSDICKDLMSKLLDKNPKTRIKSSDALKHDFFSKGIDIGRLKERQNKANIFKLSTFAQFTTMERSKSNYKRYVFRESVIAYMALNFTDKDEAKQIKGIFRELAGDNPKFEINKETFVEKMGKLLNNYTTQQLSDLFDTLDEDQNGTLEYEELNRALGDKKKLLNEKNLRETFDFFDVDKNGKISFEEIKNIVFKNKVIPPSVIKEFKEEINIEDENEEITYEKFLKIMGFDKYVGKK